jgi:hypothetical protein
MKRSYFQTIENIDARLPLELTDVINQLPFN